MTWDGIGDNVVKVIEGQGQRVLWKNANVTVMIKGSDERLPLEGKPNGEGILPKGLILYVRFGKVVEI